MPEAVGFPIGFVSSQTGLSTHVIRIWERRHHAVVPQRSESGRRMYTPSDIDRLVLLKQAVGNGYSISQIAGLDRAYLAELAGAPEAARLPTPGRAPDLAGSDPQKIVDACLAAIAKLDANAVHRMLKQAAVAFSRQALLEMIFCPLMDQVGRRWSDGSMRIVHGYLASDVVHAQLHRFLDHPIVDAAEKPCLLIATPAGQCCYLGAVAVAVAAKDHGWAPVFLGFNLPAEEIAAACSILGPQMIALSITCRVNETFMHDQLIRLADLLNEGCPIVVGGLASHHYRRGIESAGGAICATVEELVNLLA